MTDLITTARAYQILRDQLLERMPELVDDPDCLLDTLEGMTTLHEQLAALGRSAAEDEALAEGLMDYRKKLADRYRRFELSALHKRTVILNCMADLDLKTVVAPDLRLTRKRLAPEVIITDEAALPENFVRVKREPDKVAIKKALNEGQQVAGATLSNGSETLQLKI
jgi:hypothetical protein